MGNNNKYFVTSRVIGIDYSVEFNKFLLRARIDS